MLAGALSAEFEVRAPDNPVTDGQVTAQLCLQTGGQNAVCQAVIVADDEVNINALEVGIVPEAVFAGQPFPFSASLVDAAGTAQRTNVTGQVELLASPLLLQLAGLTNPVPLINGYWSNSISVQGEALDAQLGVSAAGYRSSSRRFDVLPGREVAITFNDAVWHGGLGRFLVAEPPQTNAPARLTEIDPQTGQRGRSLALPRAARRVAISDDGAVAWLASSQSTLQRVDVAAWQFDREYPVDMGTTNTDPRDLVVLPGEPERVVVVANINNTGWQVMLFDHGTGFTNRAALPGSIASLALIDPGFLGNNRVRIFDDGVPRPGEYGPLGWAGGGVPMLFTPTAAFSWPRRRCSGNSVSPRRVFHWSATWITPDCIPAWA